VIRFLSGSCLDGEQHFHNPSWKSGHHSTSRVKVALQPTELRAYAFKVISLQQPARKARTVLRTAHHCQLPLRQSSAQIFLLRRAPLSHRAFASPQARLAIATTFYANSWARTELENLCRTLKDLQQNGGGSVAQLIFLPRSTPATKV
jgi:hypothetical protein